MITIRRATDRLLRARQSLLVRLAGGGARQLQGCCASIQQSEIDADASISGRARDGGGYISPTTGNIEHAETVQLFAAGKVNERPTHLGRRL